MIAKEDVVRLVKERLDDQMFIVDISVSANNDIRVFVDSFDGMTIEQCIHISRNVEHNLDREEEDFSLQVSSPGLTESFKVKQQYEKYTGKEIEVKTTGDIELEGLLKKSDDEGIVLETSKHEKVEGHKKKQLVVKEHILKYDEIKSAKAVISFK
ncbi:ribosome assembly cofactor RimP [Prolixibacteraceae bacterium Z1-6]|uniref:Ribosome maturation factor RimP n=1 Tax=Draconibacterium aestuarii TaxID=2998507 RepID=A0A9X3F4H8_9BACT|nr:ribosome assembly cofactor RimP [Prolixibacteraceae bacterium Z1-6]